MLNEELEYDEIISGKRLKKEAYNGDMEGIRRPLLIIARKRIQEYNGDWTNKDELIAFVKNELSTFCRERGVSEDKIEAFSDGSIFQEINFSKNNKINSVHKITFDDIIAEALCRGNLKKWILLYKNIELSDVTVNGKKLDFVKDKENGPKNWDRVLKIMSCYLINKYYSGQNENVIKWSDIGNWLGMKSFEYKKDVKKLEFKKMIIFEQKNISGIIKIKPNEEFLKQFDFKIIEEGSEIYDDGYVYCEDQGTERMKGPMYRND